MDARACCPTPASEHPHARLNGFESKPYAIQWSRFAEVLYLDADNVPVRDPTFLFDTPQYTRCGAIFFGGNRVFPHRNGRKWSLYENPQVPGFERERECLGYIDELKRDWSPAAQTLPTNADHAAIAAMDGRRFDYHRVGYDHRPMVFRGDGTITVGGAAVPHRTLRGLR